VYATVPTYVYVEICDFSKFLRGSPFSAYRYLKTFLSPAVQGSRYWFAARRIWVEEREEEAAAQARYYSTRAQLTELLEALDPDQYERELYENIISHREDFEVSFLCGTSRSDHPTTHADPDPIFHDAADGTLVFHIAKFNFDMTENEELFFTFPVPVPGSVL
jgi:hypothetical protein